MKINLAFPILLCALITGCSQVNESVYLFSYIVQGKDKEGLRLAYSTDGYDWKSVQNGRSFLTPSVGSTKNDKQFILHGDSSTIMRDPCIIAGNDGFFHMVWTVAWNEKGIGYASSKDLVHWSEQRYIPVMAHEPDVVNCWAPEIFFDEKNYEYLVFWASTVPGKFPSDSTDGNRFNNRIYYVTTKDFLSFSEIKLFYDHGLDVIDATIQKAGKQYLMFIKEYNISPPHDKNISLIRSETLYGPFPPARPLEGKYWGEGPTAIKIGKYWVVYFDRYTEGKMGAMRSEDLVNWEDISDKINFPEGVSHGTVFTINRKILDNLINN